MHHLKSFVLLALMGGISVWAQETPTKATKLKEVKIIKERKAIEQKADRTIFDFANQPHLNSGSLLEGIKKLPGLVSSDVAGMMYQGKILDVYVNGRPLNISSEELNSYLEGMPANAIERIEVITQPGAEFPATSGGAILNIITNKKSVSYFSATYNNSTHVSNYNHLRWKESNSVLLNARNKYFAWQLNLGENYRENAVWVEVVKNLNGASTTLSSTNADRIGRSNFVKSGLTFDIKKDRLLLNYDVDYNNNSSNTLGNGLGFSTNDKSKTTVLRQDVAVTYQKRFDNKDQKLDLAFNFSSNANDFAMNSIPSNQVVLANLGNQKVYNFKVDYSQPVKILDEGKVSFGGVYDRLLFQAESQGVTNLDYERKTAAGYLEFQAKLKKFDFILGGRGENYAIFGQTNTGSLTPFKQFRFFPNATIQYNLGKQVYFSLNYNKKITLPTTAALNPNNTNYQNPNITYTGNPSLRPTLFDNYEVKLSAFDYAFIGYNVSVATNQVVNRVLLNNNVSSYVSTNISEMKIHNFNIGLPLPYMLFTKGLKEMMKFNFNPDKVSFMYLYAGYQLHQISDLNAKGFWVFNIMSQVALPKDIKLVANYKYITAKGNYFYFVADKPFSNSLDISLSRKFLDNQLTVSVNANDVFNTNQSVFNSYGTPLLLSNKNDTRQFGFSINYKIPTKNKPTVKEEDLLKKEKKEGNDVISN